MEYRKTGRGGAGNFYSQQDMDKVSKSAAEDIEAQRSTSNLQPDDLETKATECAHSGRGGAGNLTDRGSLTKATTETADITPGLEERRPPEVGYYGRGGAGNYKVDDPARMAEQTRKASETAEKIHQNSVRDVDKAMREPEKAYLGGQDKFS